MIPLVSKDLRLSLDAIAPLLLIIVGFLFIGWLASVVAPGAGLRLMPAVDARDLLSVTAVLVAVASPMIAGWCAAAVFVGDRGHRAESLAHVIPARGSLRVLARFAALLPALLGPQIAVTLLGTAAMMTSSEIPWASLAYRTPLAIVALSALGIASVGLASLRWRTMISVQVAAYVGALCFTATTAALAWWTFPLTTPLVMRVGEFGGSQEVASAVRTEATIAALVVGVAVAVLAAFGIVAATTLRVKWRRWSLRGCVATFMLGWIAAMITSPVVGRTSPQLLTWPDWEERAILAASEAEITAGIADAVAMVRGGTWRGDELPFMLAHAGAARLGATPVDERSAHPLWHAFMSHESYATEKLAEWSVNWIPSDDPRAETALLKATVAFPADARFVKRLYWTLRNRHPTEFTAPWAADGDRLAGVAAVAAWQLHVLDRDGARLTEDERRLRRNVADGIRAAWPDARWDDLDRGVPLESKPS